MDRDSPSPCDIPDDCVAGDRRAAFHDAHHRRIDSVFKLNRGASTPWRSRGVCLPVCPRPGFSRLTTLVANCLPFPICTNKLSVAPASNFLATSRRLGDSRYGFRSSPWRLISISSKRCPTSSACFLSCSLNQARILLRALAVFCPLQPIAIRVSSGVGEDFHAIAVL